MNAHEFIASKGVEEAKRVLSGAPEIGSYWQEYGVDNKKYYGYDDFFGDWYEYWDIPNAPMWQKVYTKEEFSFNRIEIKELKQVVDSIYMVGDFGTLDKAKKYAVSDYTAPEVKHRLEKAIADYELVEQFRGSKA